MLKPKQNSFRDEKALDGIWDFKTDPKNIGLNENWKDGFITDSSIVVPSSWNDLDPELSDYIGVSWYQTSFLYFQSLGFEKYFLKI